MHIVAVHRLQGSEEELARKLAAALGITPYEARSRVRAPEGGPVIVARFAAAEPAAQCVRRLQEAGFSVLQLDTETAEENGEGTLVRRLRLGEQALQAITREETPLTLPYAEVTLLLRGFGITSHTTTETTRERKFSLGRAIATQGLSTRKTVKKVEERTAEHREAFLHLYAPGRPPLLLRQGELVFEGAGAEQKLSREANFAHLCSELRRRCPAARWDERLLTRAGQAQLLGPGFAPETHLELAIALLARCAGAVNPAASPD